MRLSNREENILIQIIRSIVALIFLLILAIAFYFIIDGEIVNSGGTNRIYEEYKPSEKKGNYSLKDIVAINPEVEAWITIDGTNVDYPIVHASNNKKYLTLNALGEYSTSGSLFIDCDNSCDFQDFNTIIYGHNMSNGDMFGDLDEYNNKYFFNEHSKGSLIYKNKEFCIDFFAFINDADGYDRNIYNPGIVGKEKINTYLRQINHSAKHLTNSHINENDRIVLLSTCNEIVTNGRTILVGKLCPASHKQRIILKKKRIHVYSWMYIIEALLCILLIIVLHEKKIRRK